MPKALYLKVPDALMSRIQYYRFTNMKETKTEAITELLERALDEFEARQKGLRIEPIVPGDPDYAIIKARKDESIEELPWDEVEKRLKRIKAARKVRK
ncbi:MAG: hypothetical protein A3G93_14920 [Nitrospinae bacterium RIFCSPLOWO2_12_FULL_45_22]|nr:MAG: hypothetical protein A3G93_14920 [Nitrospinae bacterium RIFCSPLOWO2_12_FULL_45_22]